jgi:hypothetical protein
MKLRRMTSRRVQARLSAIATAAGRWEAWVVKRRVLGLSWLAAAVAACVCLVPVPAAAAAGSTVREDAAGLRMDPLYIDESQSRLLTVPERGKVRLRIVRQDIGRIQIAVVSPRSVERAGGLAELANAIDQAMPGRRGSLVVTTGSAWHVVTSHGVVAPTAAALRTAVVENRDRGLAAQLLAAVDGIAEVDPGAGADANAPVPGLPTAAGGGQSNDVGDDIGDSFRLGVLIVAGAIALPFILGVLLFLGGWRRRREAAQDRETLQRGDARDELIALGEEIQALDLDVEMPNASPLGRDEYERALKLYDRANQLLANNYPSEVELYEARRSLEEGRRRVAAARESLAG